MNGSPHQLDGARMRLRRAEEHRQQIQDVVSAYVEAQPFKLDFENEPVAVGVPTNILARVTTDPPLLALGAIAGDAIHNLRAALDYVTWELSVKQAGPPPTDLKGWRGIQFPIFHAEKRFTDARSTRLGKVNPNLWSTFEQIQPYLCTKPAEHPLAVLEELWNLDKHRTIPMVGAIARIEPVWHLMAGSGSFKMLYEWAPFRDGERVAEIHFDTYPQGETPKVDAGFKSVFDIKFDVGVPAAGLSVRSTLASLQQVVASIVDHFASEL